MYKHNFEFGVGPLTSLRSFLLAVILFPLLAGQFTQEKDKRQRTREKGKKPGSANLLSFNLSP